MKTNDCQWCDGTGVMTIPNGQDDFDQDYCSQCPEGKRLSFFDWFRVRKAELVTAKTI